MKRQIDVEHGKVVAGFRTLDVRRRAFVLRQIVFGFFRLRRARHFLFRQIMYQRLFQCLAVQRLCEVVVESFFEELFFCAGDGVRRQDEERGPFGVRQRFRCAESFDAVHAGHSMVEQHRVVAFGCEAIQCALPVGYGVDLKPRRFEEAFDDQEIQFVVVHYEDMRRRCGKGRVIGGFFRFAGQARHEVADGRVAGNFLRQRGGEDGADAVCAFKDDVAAHERRKPLRNGKTESRALDASVPHAVQAFKTLEQAPFVFVADPDARVADFKSQHEEFAHRVALTGDAEIHASCFGVFGGVGQKIYDDLLDARHVAHQRVGQRRVHVESEGQSFALGSGLRHVHGVADQVRKTISALDDFELAGFDFGKVQDVVDDVKKRLARGADVSRVADDGGVFSFPEDHFVHAEYGVDRRADFMAHVGEEVALRAVRHIRGGFFPPQRIVFRRFSPHGENIAAHREKDQQQNADGAQKPFVDAGDVPGHRGPRDIARHGAVRFRQVGGEDEVALSVPLDIGSRRAAGVQLLAQLPELLPDFGGVEKFFVAFAVIFVRNDEIPEPVQEQEADGGIVVRQREAVREAFVVVETVQYRPYVAVPNDRHGEKQSASQAVVDDGLPAKGAGQARIFPAGKRGALNGLAPDGQETDGAASRRTAKRCQKSRRVLFV